MSIRFDYDFGTETAIICDMPSGSTVVVDGVEYVPQRTCEVLERVTEEHTAFGTLELMDYKCSACGCIAIDYEDNYCPWCGAKVVE